MAFMPDRTRRFRDTTTIDVDCCESLWKGPQTDRLALKDRSRFLGPGL
jgi:hypothetical protein